LISKLLPAKYREVVLPKRIVAIIPIKTLALESPQTVKVIGDSLRIVARKIKTVLNQDAPVAIIKCHRQRN
jgi:hypothetical protein